MFKQELKVRFSDCDGLGHVNHAAYFTFMEEARTEIFRLFNPSLALSSWNLIVVSARCDFLQQVAYPEQLTVFTWVSRLGNSSFDLEHAIRNEAGDWAARGQATMVAYDYQVQKPLPLWPEIREALQMHRQGPEGVPDFR